MPRKKPKKRSGADSRGYSKGIAAPKAENSGQKEVKVSSKTHDGLVNLLSQLSTNACDGRETAESSPFDSNHFVRKVTKIHDRLTELGFSESSIEEVVKAIANQEIFSLETALDWLCLHLETESLPPLFTEGLVRDNAASLLVDPNHLTIITAPQGARKYSEGGEQTRLSEEELFPSPTEPSIAETATNEGVEKIEDDSSEAAAYKAWIVEQYQYETEEEEDEPANADENDAQAESTMEEKSRLLPEEARLVEMEEELCAKEADLNDDASNYMRSKYEVKELQKSVKQLRKQVEGLRKKVAKLKAKNSEAVVEIQEDQDEEGEMGDIFSLFEPEQQEESMNGQAQSVPIEAASDEQAPVQIDQGTSQGLCSKAPSIPANWTGKTPKKVLEEWCQKRKIPKPSYQKLSQRTNNGCRIVVKHDKKQTPLTLSQEGPFFSWNDAQQFLATEALYSLSSSLPLYRLFPPVFRDLWISWMDREKEERDETRAKKRGEKKAKMENLANSVRRKALEAPCNVKSDEHVNGSVLDANGSMEGKYQDPPSRKAAPTEMSPSGEELKNRFALRQNTTEYQEMLKDRKVLPMYSYRAEFLETVRENAVTILCAETGAGKTTQGPQFLLEEGILGGVGDKMSIVCTQPRRISAISVAERVSDEICDRTIGQTVGYHIRMESKRSSNTKLLFCTTGVILRRLQDDPNLSGVTHVFVDEVHERQWQTDFLLVALRKLISTTRIDLKVVLMSATLDAELFRSFFGGAPLLSVPGRTFPVSNYYLEDLIEATNHVIEEGSPCSLQKDFSSMQKATLWVTAKGGEKRKETVQFDDVGQDDLSEDYIGYSLSTRRSMDRVDEKRVNYDLILDVLGYLLLETSDNETLLPPESVESCDLSSGAVLIFLPGIGEIRSLVERLEGSRTFGARSRFDIVPMHSTLSSKEQRRAFLKARNGRQKIICSTNICETSITIPDVVCVIDTGLVREVRQNTRTSTSMLVTDFCARASTKQRSGRAGRVRPGICCRLFSSRTSQYTMREQAVPELQRVPLEEVCLSILAGRLSSTCVGFLQQAPQPPKQDAIDAALRLLEEVGAIESNGDSTAAYSEKLTPLGYHLAKLPVHVRLGKMLIFGAMFKCLDKILTVAASLSSKSPFSSYVRDSQQAKAKHRAFQHPSSDFLTSCNVFNSFRLELNKGASSARKFCDQNFLNWPALMEIRDSRKQFLDLLEQIGFVTRSSKEDALDNISKRPGDVKAYDVYGDNEVVVHAVICSGMYANVANVTASVVGDVPTVMHNKEQVFIHSSSVNSGSVSVLPSNWLVYHEKFAIHKRVNLASTCYVNALALLLFGGSLRVRHTERIVIIDDWIQLGIAAQTGVLFRELHHKIDGLLRTMIGKPSYLENEKSKTMVDGIVQLLVSSDDN